MRKLAKYAIALAAIGILVAGCQNGPTPVDPDYQSAPPLALYVLPAGADLVSATFYIYVTIPSNQQVYIHRVTDSWDEYTVTWNNFGGAYAAATSGSFAADATDDWRSVDITSLVSDWIYGVNPNYGILLDQDIINYPRAVYHSREASVNEPYLEIVYELDGDEYTDYTIADADAYITQYEPDTNFGSYYLLFTGYAADVNLEKQTLVFFDIEGGEEPPDGCSLTIGYWKNHAGMGRQADMVTPLLPIWLGDAGGDKSLNVDTNTMAVDILKMNVYGHEDNGITKLYAQLLGTKLNIENGADDTDVAAAIVEADAFLADYDWNDWDSLTEEEQEWVLDLKDMFDDYNNGDIGPGHCDD